MQRLRVPSLPSHRGWSTPEESARDVFKLNLEGQMSHMQNVPVRDGLRAGETPAVEARAVARAEVFDPDPPITHGELAVLT